jgi:predicted AAA+ superfamily ATPase
MLGCVPDVGVHHGTALKQSLGAHVENGVHYRHMYQRMCNPLLSRSFFLFGARGTGKTSLLNSLLGDAPSVFWFDLLDDALYQRLLANPGLFEEMIPTSFNSESWVVADEIQRLPGLLNYVHRLIEKRSIKFALSGSSARKLKRSGANLLAGRAFTNELFPLTFAELGERFDLDQIINWGALPSLFSLSTEEERREYLRSYVGTYIRQEIKEEQVVRNLEPFVRFLEVIAQFNGQIVNASQIARDSGTDSKAIVRYLEILNDTLLGFFLDPYRRSVRKVQSEKSKFYLFDLGVKRALQNDLTSTISPRSYAFGAAFEHFFILECHRMRRYLKLDEKAYFLRTKDHAEIDLIIERPGSVLYVIEIKSSERVDETKLRSSIALAKDLKPTAIWVASREPTARYLEDGVEILPWQEVLARLYPAPGRNAS